MKLDPNSFAYKLADEASVFGVKAIVIGSVVMIYGVVSVVSVMGIIMTFRFLGHLI